MRFIGWLAAGLLSVAAADLQAAEYYVATNGSDASDGLSVTSAWLTVGTAVNRIQGGDTLWVRGGTYRGRVTFTNATGGPGAPIRVFAYNNEAPVIKGSQLVEGWQPLSNGIWYVESWPVNSQQVFADGVLLQMLGWPNDYMALRACSCADWYYIPHGFSCAQIDPATRSLDIGNPLTNMPPDSFYYDPDTYRLYIRLAGDAEPFGYEIEAATDLGAFYDESSKGWLHLKGLHFRHASTFSYTFAGWPLVLVGRDGVIEDCDIQWGDASGLTMRQNTKALNCNVSNNGMLGIVCNTFTNILVSGCTVYSNNYREFHGTYAGGVRFIPNAGATVENSEVAYNRCTGIWFDTCTAGHPLVVRNNLVHHNWIPPRRAGDTTTPGSKGIFIEFSANAHVYNNVVYSNANIGIHLSASRDTRVENNLVLGTRSIPGGHRGLSGITMDNPQSGYNVASNVVVNNLVLDNLTDYDVIAIASNGTSVFANRFDHNLYFRTTGAGTVYPSSSFVAAYLNKSIYNTLAGWRGATGWDAEALSTDPQLQADWIPSPSSPAIDAGSPVRQPPVDRAGLPRPVDGDADGAAAVDIGPHEVSAPGGIVFVDAHSTNPVAPYATRETAAVSPAVALAAATNGSLILVAPGYYPLDAPVLIDKPVALIGRDGAGVTVLDAGGSNRCLVVTASGVLVDGLSLVNGHSVADGGAVWLGSGVLLQQCTVTGSTATAQGGGIYASGGSTVRAVRVGGCRAAAGGGIHAATGSRVEDVTLEANAAGMGGGLYLDAHAVVEKSVLSGNMAASHGAGIYAAASSSVFAVRASGNDATNGFGGGIYLAAGASAEQCYLDGNIAARGGGIHAVSGNRIANSTVSSNTASLHGGGVYAAHAVSIERCRVMDNVAETGDGGGVVAEGGSMLLNVIAAGNQAGGRGGGLYLGDTARADFCTVVDNEAVIAGGGVCGGGSGVELANSVVWDNVSAAGSNWLLPGDPVVSHVVTDPIPPGNGNRSDTPLFVHAATRNYTPARGSSALDAASPSAVLTNDLDGKLRPADGDADGVNSADAGALEGHGTHYVDAASPAPVRPYLTWTTAARTLQDAINNAAQGDLILVAPGTYAASSHINVNRGVTIRSTDGPETTFLDGGHTRRVLYLNHNDAMVDGFTIQHGRADAGAGAYVVRGRLTGCILRGNHSTNDLGGVFAYGALYNGSRYYCQQAYDALAHEGGGGVLLLRGGTMDNCLVMSNTAVYGGGVLSIDGGALAFATIVTNTAGQGGGWYARNGSSIRNAILYGNDAGGNYIVAGTNPVWQGVMATPLPPGDGADDSDPLFAAATAGDYRLTAGSPAIDTALGSIVAVDLAGWPRPLDGNADTMAAADRGAYEFMHPLADTDADGLADTNEWDIGTSPVNADTDADGLGDGGEVIAGTDPLDVADVFMAGWLPPADNMVILSWPARTGRVFNVYAAESLYDSFTFLTNLPAGTGELLLAVPATNATRYYAVEVIRP